MLKINYAYIKSVEEAEEASDLAPFLQKAIELEHSTIPPYLTALFSIKSGSNREISRLIYSVVVDEMLHFTIACNILNALGGHPHIYDPAFIPNYPTALPLNINGSLVVGLERFSKKQLNDVMEIEEPEKPLVFPDGLALRSEMPTYATIGLFYAAIKDKIQALPGDRLPGPAELQVVSDRFSAEELFPIHTKEDAIRAIDIIVEQGEGTTQKPVDQANNLGHYYRFKEILVGNRLVEDPSVPEGYSYTGSSIPFDEEGVYPIYPNMRIGLLPEGSAEREAAQAFASTYTSLLRQLHETFNGAPQKINETLAAMRELSHIAEGLAQTPFPGKPGHSIGAPFEFANV